MISNGFVEGKIDGVEIVFLPKYVDHRGWSAEFFRSDWGKHQPQMGYVSSTLPGQSRGPHEHRFQTDCFHFLGDSEFVMFLWDNRKTSSSNSMMMKLVIGLGSIVRVVVPPGVVHGYRNVGHSNGLVINVPDQLYRGIGRCVPVDEVRHEDDPHSPFQLTQ